MEKNKKTDQEKTQKYLTMDEAAEHLRLTKGYLYKLVMRKEIPYYKPSYRITLFLREDLDRWMQEKCRVESREESEARADIYFMNSRKFPN